MKCSTVVSSPVRNGTRAYLACMGDLAMISDRTTQRAATGQRGDNCLKLSIALLAAAWALVSCAGLPRETALEAKDPEARDIDTRIDQLCQAVGGRRAGTIANARRYTDSDCTNYYAEATLEFGGEPAKYHFCLDQRKRITQFMPADFSVYARAGYNEVTDQQLRKKLLLAVEKANAYLKFTYHGKAAIARGDDYYAVAFRSITEEERKKLAAEGMTVLHPYVTFLVNKKNEVFGVFWGA